MTYAWILPVPRVAWTAKPKKKKRARCRRSEKGRAISQDTVRAIRAAIECLPKSPAGVRHKRGSVKALTTQFGVTLTFLYSILYMGIRDEEREP